MEWLILANIALTLGLYYRTRRVKLVLDRSQVPHKWTTKKVKK